MNVCWAYRSSGLPLGAAGTPARLRASCLTSTSHGWLSCQRDFDDTPALDSQTTDYSPTYARNSSPLRARSYKERYQSRHPFVAHRRPPGLGFTNHRNQHRHPTSNTMASRKKILLKVRRLATCLRERGHTDAYTRSSSLATAVSARRVS